MVGQTMSEPNPDNGLKIARNLFSRPEGQHWERLPGIMLVWLVTVTVGLVYLAVIMAAAILVGGLLLPSVPLGERWMAGVGAVGMLSGTILGALFARFGRKTVEQIIQEWRR
jgi:hypothetical protein